MEKFWRKDHHNREIITSEAAADSEWLRASFIQITPLTIFLIYPNILSRDGTSNDHTALVSDGADQRIIVLLRSFLMTTCFTGLILSLGAFYRFIIRWMATILGDLFKPVILDITGLVCIVITLFAGTWICVRNGLRKAALKKDPLLDGGCCTAWLS
jgi:hypothetical protein